MQPFNQKLADGYKNRHKDNSTQRILAYSLINHGKSLADTGSYIDRLMKLGSDLKDKKPYATRDTVWNFKQNQFNKGAEKTKKYLSADKMSEYTKTALITCELTYKTNPSVQEVYDRINSLFGAGTVSLDEVQAS